MKLKALSLIMIASLLASMLLIGVGSAEFLRGATAKFEIKLPDGSQFMNVTTAQYDIGSKFNITVRINDVTNMLSYGVTVVWNSTFQNATGRWWLSPFFIGEQMALRWSGPFPPRITNDYRTVYPLLPPFIGVFEGLGQMAFGPGYAVTGSYDICIIEFQVNQYGPLGFYLWKDPANYKPWPYTGGQPELATEGKFPEAFHAAYCTWSAPPAGLAQPYDVVWAPGYTGKANAIMYYPPYPPEATKTVEPEPPIVNEIVTVTVTQTKAGFDGTNFFPITNVTIDWGDESDLEWHVPAGDPPVAVFTHNYTVEDDYNINVYCYAEGMPPGLAWYNETNPITVVPEFPVYLIMPLFLTTTIIAVASAKIVWSKKPKRRVNVIE